MTIHCSRKQIPLKNNLQLILETSHFKQTTKLITMSGSGGGAYAPPESLKFDCEEGIIFTAVSSVNLTVLKSHRIKDILNIELSETETVILVNGNGEILGSIAHRSTTDLLNCIKNGNQYQATITSINMPACNVKVERI